MTSTFNKEIESTELQYYYKLDTSQLNIETVLIIASFNDAFFYFAPLNYSETGDIKSEKTCLICDRILSFSC